MARPAIVTPQVQLATRISAELRRRIKRYSVEADMSMLDIVTTALEEFLERASKAPRKKAS